MLALPPVKITGRQSRGRSAVECAAEASRTSLFLSLSSQEQRSKDQHQNADYNQQSDQKNNAHRPANKFQHCRLLKSRMSGNVETAKMFREGGRKGVAGVCLAYGSTELAGLK
ncbi:MAG: hypothetical protein H0T56_03940 [Pseudaminobacter sp.]|nr:hypothetical protein [Pseudaminobacter sp.]